MKKALFLLEFKRALIPFAISVLAIFGGLSIFERVMIHFGQARENVEAVMTGVLGAVAIGFAFPCGARTFSRELKENQSLFLQSLPMSRRWTWTILVLANLSALVCSLVLVPMLRPSVGIWLMSDKGWVSIEFFPLFAAGCCFSLLFMRTLLTYIVGAIVTSALLLEISLCAIYFVPEPGLPGEYFGPEYFDFGFWLVASGAMTVLFFLLSLRFFTRAEFQLLKMQLKNGVALFLSALAYILVLWVLQISGIFALRDPWGLGSYQGALISPDGKQMVLVEHRENHPQFSRISILDIGTGNVLFQSRQRGAIDAVWMPRRDAVGIVVRGSSALDRLGYVLPGSDSVLRISTGGKKLGATKFWFSQITDFSALGDHQFLAVVHEGDAGKVLAIDDLGVARELCSGTLRNGSAIEVFDDRALVRFNNDPFPSKVWSVGAQVKELEWVPSKGRTDWMTCVMGDRAYESLKMCADELAKSYPFADRGNEPKNTEKAGAYVLGNDPRVIHRRPSWGWWGSRFVPIEASTWVFYLEAGKQNRTGKLHVFQKQKHAWLPVAEGIPLDANQMNMLSHLHVLFGLSSGQIDSRAGLAVYIVQRAGTDRAYLYDANIGKTMEVAAVEKQDRTVSVGMAFIPGMEGVLVYVNQRRGTEGTFEYFEYALKSGLLTPVTIRAWHPDLLLYIDNQGNQIYIDRFRWEPGQRKLIYAGADQRQRQLWPPRNN